MSTVGDMLSTVGDAQYRGGYHDTYGGYREYRGCTQITKDCSAPQYWTPPCYSWYPPTCIMISSMVLSIPHGTEHTLYRMSTYHRDGHTSHFGSPGLLAQVRWSTAPSPALALIRRKQLLSALFTFSISFVYMLYRLLHQRSATVLKLSSAATDCNIPIISSPAKHPEHCFDFQTWNS